SGSMTSMMAVLVAACPSALALAAPATSVAAIAVATRFGVLVKSTAFMEELTRVDTLLLDKTGTVTEGSLQVVGVVCAPDVETEEAERLAGMLAGASSHPVSRAIHRLRREAGSKAAAVNEVAGKGVEGEIDGRMHRLGRSSLHSEAGATPFEEPEHDGPVVGLSRDVDFLAWILLADTVREDAASSLNQLRNMGLTKQMLVSGDRAALVEEVAAELAVDEAVGDALPAQKLEVVHRQQREGRRVLMVGDGINDALALKAANVGVAIDGGNTDVALASADLILSVQRLDRLVYMIRLAREARKVMNINFGIALSVSLVFITLASAGLVGPVATAVIHNVDALLIIMNSARLLSFRG
ncbi:MAG: HAD-IC family P-type ATPase, partial [Pseudomonadota bacterium]